MTYSKNLYKFLVSTESKSRKFLQSDSAIRILATGINQTNQLCIKNLKNDPFRNQKISSIICKYANNNSLQDNIKELTSELEKVEESAEIPEDIKKQLIEQIQINLNL